MFMQKKKEEKKPSVLGALDLPGKHVGHSENDHSDQKVI